MKVLIAATVLVALAAVGLWEAVRTSGDRAPSTAVTTPATTTPTAAPPHMPAPSTKRIAAADASSSDERDRVLAVVRRSGEASEPWVPQARSLFDSIAGRNTAFTFEGCFVAGCAATFTFASRGDYELQRRDSEASTEYAAWTGGKQWTAPMMAGDRVEVTLVLYRPD
jgi:hypothetical protein